MSNFEELASPTEENISVEHRDKWFVTIKHLTRTNSGLLTNDGSGIMQTTVGADQSKFYFESEIQAHSVSWLYYINNGVDYPYMDDWDDAKKREFNNNAVPGAGTLSESQPMEFI